MTYISDEIRTFVYQRAKGCCEYCLTPQAGRSKRHEIDHIYAEKHGGETIEANLCLSCIMCNRYKGSDIASIDPLTGEGVFLFHPRRDSWADHFRINGATVEPLTPVGRVTVFLLKINAAQRLQERQILIRLKRYPPDFTA